MGIKNARYGKFLGNKYLFTHYNPVTHEAWSDDIPVLIKGATNEYGMWVTYDSIEWC